MAEVREFRFPKIRTDLKADKRIRVEGLEKARIGVHVPAKPYNFESRTIAEGEARQRAHDRKAFGADQDTRFVRKVMEARPVDLRVKETVIPASFEKSARISARKEKATDKAFALAIATPFASYIE